jgi:DNA (cytosine-5)-methyltransferase 1
VKSVEIFAGAGGLAIGAHQAGINCSVLLDFSPGVCKTLRSNAVRGIAPMASARIIQSDVREIRFSDFSGHCDILLGGPPCQPFSQGGLRRNVADPRNMFPETVRALHEIRPSAFLFENVKGITTGGNRNYAEFVRLQLQNPELGVAIKALNFDEQLAKLEDAAIAGADRGLVQYNVVMHTVNVADYGVPQKRERVFFVGFRNDLHLEWHFPEETHSAASLARDQSSRGTYWDRHRVGKNERPTPTILRGGDAALTKLPWVTVRDALSDLGEPFLSQEQGPSQMQHDLVLGARPYRGHTGSPLDQPSKALKAGVNGVPGGENMLRRLDGTVRYFSIRECARLQTFPDEYLFEGAWSEQMRQIGNAVPSSMAEKVLRSMKSVLQDRQTD